MSQDAVQPDIDVPLAQLVARVYTAAMYKGTDDHEDVTSILRPLLAERDRARHLAKHLFLMIPREEWRDAGAIGPGGEVEGYYWAADIEEEIRGWGDDPGRTELRS